ncbi:MAG: hypothetical protein DRH49_03780 [Candidatus Coatesbacteria bacterium]|nr:MAG: hypothetical protein DRH49_03780 [Candidatus Coatesbacteria bacterium]
MLILLILRTMVILSLMLIFIGLTLHFTYSSKKIRPLVVILDISPSMNYLLEGEGKTRFERAMEVLWEIGKEANSSGFKIELVTSDAKRIEMQSDELEKLKPLKKQEESLYSGVLDIIALFGDRARGFILITDGGLNDIDVEHLHALPDNLYIVNTGKNPLSDIALIDLQLPNPILASMDQVAELSGIYYGREAVSFKVILSQGGEVLAEVPYHLNRSGYFSIDIPFRASGDIDVFSAEVVCDKDTVELNNKVIEATNVINRRMRTLIVSPQPSPDYAFVKRALMRDTALDLSTYCITPAGGLISEETTVDIAGYTGLLPEFDSIVVMGEVPVVEGVSIAEHLDRLCADDGVGIVYIAQDGDTLSYASSPLSMGGEGIRVRLSTPTWKSGVFLFMDELNCLDGLVASGSGDVSKRSWSEALVYDEDGIPRLACGRYLNGVSYALAFWGLWRVPYALRGDSIDRLMSAIVRMSSYPHLQGRPRIEVSSKEPIVGEEVKISVPSKDCGSLRYSIYRLLDGGEEVVRGGELSYELNGYRTAFVPEVVGVYRIEVYSGDKSNSIYFICNEDIERDTGSHSEILSRVLGGDRVFSEDEIDDLIGGLSGKTFYEVVVDRAVSSTSSPWLYVAVVLLITGEWYLRRRYGYS